MFGLIKEQNTWDFAAFGKHPSAGDYLSLGTLTPVLSGFSMWVTQGFDLLPAENRNVNGLSWEFWANGPNGKTIIGMMKSSADKVGREFPFLIIGEGRLSDTPANWNLLPFACEKTWMVFDRLFRLKWKALTAIDRALTRIKTPKEIWPVHQYRHEQMKSVEISRDTKKKHIDYMNKMNNVDGLSRLDRFAVRVDVGQKDQHPLFAVKLLSLLKTRRRAEPGAVFIGGIGSVKQMVVLKGPPVSGDFPLLWNLAVDLSGRELSGG